MCDRPIHEIAEGLGRVNSFLNLLAERSDLPVEFLNIVEPSVVGIVGGAAFENGIQTAERLIPGRKLDSSVLDRARMVSTIRLDCDRRVVNACRMLATETQKLCRLLRRTRGSLEALCYASP